MAEALRCIPRTTYCPLFGRISDWWPCLNHADWFHLLPARAFVVRGHQSLRFAQMLLNRGELEGVRILAPKIVDLLHLNHLAPASLPYELGSEPFRGYGFGLGSRVLLNVAESDLPGSVFRDSPLFENHLVRLRYVLLPVPLGAASYLGAFRAQRPPDLS